MQAAPCLARRPQDEETGRSVLPPEGCQSTDPGLGPSPDVNEKGQAAPQGGGGDKSWPFRGWQRGWWGFTRRDEVRSASPEDLLAAEGEGGLCPV